MNHRRLAQVLTAVLIVSPLLACDSSSPTQPPASPVTVTAISPAAGLSGDMLTVSGSGFRPGVTVMVGGTRARVATVVDTLITLIAPYREAGAVDVVVVNQSGSSQTLVAGFTYEAVAIHVSSETAAAGSELKVTWEAPGGRSAADWIGLFLLSDDNDHYGWHEPTGGVASGTLSLTVPTQPGRYEFRYLVRDVAAAHSASVTVTPGGN